MYSVNHFSYNYNNGVVVYICIILIDFKYQISLKESKMNDRKNTRSQGKFYTVI